MSRKVEGNSFSYVFRDGDFVRPIDGRQDTNPYSEVQSIEI